MGQQKSPQASKANKKTPAALKKRMEKTHAKTEAIKKAVEAYKNNPTLSATMSGRIHGCSKSIISLRLRELIIIRHLSNIYIKRQNLSLIEEYTIILYIAVCYKSGLPLYIKHLNNFANEILAKRDRIVGRNQHNKFFRRHLGIKTKFSRPMKKNRMLQEDADIYIKFFKRYDRLYTKWSINRKEESYNIKKIDAAISLQYKSRVIVFAEEADTVTIIQSDHNREWATLIACIRANLINEKANSQAVPTFIIYKGKEILEDYRQLVDQLDQKAALWTTENGQTNNKVAIQQLKHFIRNLPPIDGYRILLLDDHNSHYTIAFRDLALNNRIILLYLPPHTTHKLQLLDVGFFGPLTHYYSRLVEEFTSIGTGWGVSKREYIEQILLALEKTNSERIIHGAFTKTGLVPFDPDIVLAQLKHPKKQPYDFDPIELPVEFFERIEAEAAVKAAINNSIDRLFTPPDQSNPKFLILTIQKGMENLRIPREHQSAISLLDQLIRGTPSQPILLNQLQSYIEYNNFTQIIHERDNEKLPKAITKKKPNSKKTIGYNHYDADVRDTVNQKRKEDKAVVKLKAIENNEKKKEKVNKKAAEKARKDENKKQKAINAQRKRDEAVNKKIRKDEQKKKEKENKKTRKQKKKAVKAADRAANSILKRKYNRGAARQSEIDLSRLSIIEENCEEGNDSVYHNTDKMHIKSVGVDINQLEANAAKKANIVVKKRSNTAVKSA